MLFWNKVTALLTALLLLAGCSSDVGKAGTDDSLYRAIDRKNLAWVEEAAQGADLDHIYYRSANNTISALSAELTGEWSDASRGPTPIFRFLLEAGADVNAVHHSGRSPSFDAMGFSDEVSLPYMQLMLDYGMDLTAKDPDGNTLLDAALRSGNDKTALFLLESGAVPTENTLSMLFNGYTGERDGRCAYNVLRSLVADYDLNSPDIPPAVRTAILGETPDEEAAAMLDEENRNWLLCCVAAFGKPETLANLVTMEAYHTIADVEGWSLWEIAAGNGNRSMLNHLLEVSDSGELVWAALNRASAAGQMDCTAMLLERFDVGWLEDVDHGEWKVEWLWRNALIHDDPELLALLYEQGPLPDEGGVYDSIEDAVACKAQNSLTFLLEHFETEPGYHLDTAGRYNNLEAAKLLVGQGISQFSLNEALSTAAAYGSKEIVQLLLACGADPSHQEPTHGSPLLGAAQHGYLEIVELLLDHGADPRQVYWDEKDNLLIETAFGSNRILRLLIDAGAEVNYQNTDGATPLIYAVLNNRPENVSLLLENGADPNFEDIHGCTALSIAEEEGFDEIVSILKAHQ